MPNINISDLKGTREALCAAQNGLNRSGMGTSLSVAQSANIQRIINQIDVHRPLDSDGKHRIHTAQCGCTDSPIKICVECEREIIMLDTTWFHAHSMTVRCFLNTPGWNETAKPMLEIEA